MEIRDRIISVRGLRFHCRETGLPDAHPVVLLHALGAGCHDWDRVARALADRHRVLALEMRGSFDSDRAGEYSFEAMRDDVKALVDELGLERFSLVGHSMGGTVSYLFAEDWPERLDRLVIEDTPPPGAGDLPTGARDRLVPRELPEDLPLDLRMVGAIVDQLLQPDPAWWERLDRIGVPTLLLAGGPDSHVPQHRMAQVAERIPDCRVLTLGGGHFVHREQEAAFVAAVRDFLGRRPQPSAAS